MPLRLLFLKIPHRIGCGLCHCVNLLLAVIALHLTAFLLLNSLHSGIPLPEKWFRWTVRLILPDDLHPTWTRASCDLHGGLFLQNLEIRRIPSGEIVLTAGAAHLAWSPFHLVSSSLPPFKAVDLSQVQLYLPAQHSPTGLNEPALDIDHASLKAADGRFAISNLSARLGQLRLDLHGSASLRDLRATPAAQPLTLDLDFIRLLQQLRTKADTLQADIAAKWSFVPPDFHAFEILALLPEFSHSQADLHTLVLTASLNVTDGFLSVAEAQLSGWGRLPEALTPIWSALGGAPDAALPFHLQAGGPGQPLNGFSAPSRLRLQCRLSPLDIPVRQVVLATSLDPDASPLHWILSGPGCLVTGELPGWDGGPRLPEIPEQVPFHANLDAPRLDALYPQAPPHRLLRDAHAARIRMQGHFNPATRTVAGSVLASGLFLGATPFDHVHTRLMLGPDQLALTDVHIQKNPLESANGTYLHHFPSSRFSLRASGSIYPSSLNNILGPWWRRILTHIDATEPAHGDVTVWGFWNDEASLQSLTGATGDGIVYRGLAVRELQVRVRSNADWAVLEQLDGLFDGGRIAGTVAWQQDEPEGAKRAVLMDIESRAPWPAVVAASGIAGTGRISFIGNPHLTVQGILWEDPDASADALLDPDLRIRLAHPDGICGIEGLTLADLHLSGRVSRDRIDLEPLSGSFADGVFTGVVGLENWQEPADLWRHLRLQLFDADYAQLSRQMRPLYRDTTTIADPAEPEPDPAVGRVEAELSLSIGPALDASTGSGRLTVRQAQLGRIHLLGGLSRALTERGLGFSSLDLKAAAAEWELLNGELLLQRCLLTGAVLSLGLTGSLDLAADRLALRAELQFFQGLLGLVLTPVSDSIQFDVTGSLEEPVWQIRLNPFRWFQDRLLQMPDSSSR